MAGLTSVVRLGVALAVTAMLAAPLMMGLAGTASAADVAGNPIGPGYSDNHVGVECIQRALQVPMGGSPYGTFGQATYNAVVTFQERQGITPVTGAVGPVTGDRLARLGLLGPGCRTHVPHSSTGGGTPAGGTSSPGSDGDQGGGLLGGGGSDSSAAGGGAAGSGRDEGPADADGGHDSSGRSDGTGGSAEDIPGSAEHGRAVVMHARQALRGDDALPDWDGGALPYSWGAGHGSSPGPSLGTCSGYTGLVRPCPADRTLGLDCSGFTRWMYALTYGRDVLGPGNTDAQLRRVQRVENPRPGDLVFYNATTPGSTTGTTHVGIYVGNGQLINAPATGHDIERQPVTAHSGFVGYYRLAS